MNKTQVSAPPSENLSLRSWLVEEYYELLVSVSIIIFISLVSQLIRITLARAFVPKSWVRILVNEIVATAELCATCFELGNSKNFHSHKQHRTVQAMCNDFTVI